jgi:hypothetical protein
VGSWRPFYTYYRNDLNSTICMQIDPYNILTQLKVRWMQSATTGSLLCYPKRENVIGESRKLHNVELNKLYSLSNSKGMIKSKRVRWMVYVARIRAIRNA